MCVCVFDSYFRDFTYKTHGWQVKYETFRDFTLKISCLLHVNAAENPHPLWKENTEYFFFFFFFFFTPDDYSASSFHVEQ